MNKIAVGDVGDFDGSSPRLLRLEDYEIGVYRRGDKFYAYKNLCPHMGGPACEGLTMHKVEDVISEDKTYHGQRFNMDEEHIVCPWHGYEFHIESGRCVVNPRVGLKEYKTLLEGSTVYVLV
ncbi:Rieske (2Fe-2S) protein (plasmid) [Mesorhizobium sp. ORM8.1]